MEIWKKLINLKESRKPRDKFLRVWAKNQLRFEIFEKILKFTCKNLNGKLIFYPFSPIFQDFFILYTSVTYQNFWGWLGGGPGSNGPVWGGGYFFHWRKQKFRVFANSKIFKKCKKKSMKILKFFENLHVNFAIFWKYFIILSIFFA